MFYPSLIFTKAHPEVKDWTYQFTKQFTFVPQDLQRESQWGISRLTGSDPALIQAQGIEETGSWTAASVCLFQVQTFPGTDLTCSYKLTLWKYLDFVTFCNPLILCIFWRNYMWHIHKLLSVVGVGWSGWNASFTSLGLLGLGSMWHSRAKGRMQVWPWALGWERQFPCLLSSQRWSSSKQKHWVTTHHLWKINPPNCCLYFNATCVAFTLTHPPPAQSVRCEEVMEGRMHG